MFTTIWQLAKGRPHYAHSYLPAYGIHSVTLKLHGQAPINSNKAIDKNTLIVGLRNFYRAVD